MGKCRVGIYMQPGRKWEGIGGCIANRVGGITGLPGISRIVNPSEI